MSEQLHEQKVELKLLPKQRKFLESTKKEVMYSGAFGSGKAAPYYTKVYTPNGYKLMGDILVGDEVLTPDGNKAKVIKIHEQGEQDVYRITFKGGYYVECTLDHLWYINWQKARRVRRAKLKLKTIYHNEEQTSILTTEQLMNHKKYMPKINARFYIKLNKEVNFNEQKITVNPYLLGLLIGDGYLGNVKAGSGVSYTTADEELATSITNIVDKEYDNLEFKKHSYKYSYGFKYRFEQHPYPHELKQQLIDLNLCKTSYFKFIPEQYKYNTLSIRREMLQGLMDTDGWIDKNKGGGAYFCSSSQQLALDVKELAESLGYEVCNFKSQIKKCKHKGITKEFLSWQLRINGDDLTGLFKLNRKKDRAQECIKLKYPTTRIIDSIVKTDTRHNCRCIEIDDPNHLYIMDNFVKTHNTQSICIKAAMEASKKGNVVLLVRKTLASLKRTTLRSLISHDDGNNPILPDNTYVYKESKGEIILNNGGTILLAGLDNATRILSLNLGCICVDEAVELSEQEYNSLFSRLRLNIGTRQICLATNPGPCSHWLYKRFYLDNSYNREVVSAPTEENFLLPKDYLDSLVESYKGNDLLYRKYLKGEWVTAMNAIYPTFSREVHVKNINYESDRYYLGLDFGFTNATAMLLAQVAGSKVVFLEEVYKTKLLQSEILQHIHDFNNRYKGLTVIYDPSAASLGAQIQHEGINCQKANNEVVLGISRFNTKLAVREDTNEPDLYVNPNCVNFIREIENYQYDKSGSEKPIKVNDHLCDSAKYIINHLYDASSEEFTYYSIGPDDIDD